MNYRYAITSALLCCLLFLAFWLSQVGRYKSTGQVAVDALDDDFSLGLAEHSGGAASSIAQLSVLDEKQPLSALQQLLAENWSPEIFFTQEDTVPPITSRADFVNAAQHRRDGRQFLIDHAYPAPLDENERYILLSNERFFSISSQEDANFRDRKLYLYFEGIEPAVDKPVVRFFPHLFSHALQSPTSHADVSIVSASSAGDEYQSNQLQGVFSEVMLESEAIVLSLNDIPSSVDAWVIQVERIQGLSDGPRRYLLYLK